jgi:signal transduction histidine kinase
MDVRKNLYLIFKEATNNMVKYSDASNERFEIKEEKENLYLSIHDNGKGFDLNQTNQGNGLKNMKKRAEEIGARLSIKSMPHSGTLIQLIVPV